MSIFPKLPRNIKFMGRISCILQFFRNSLPFGLPDVSQLFVALLPTDRCLGKQMLNTFHCNSVIIIIGAQQKFAHVCCLLRFNAVIDIGKRIRIIFDNSQECKLKMRFVLLMGRWLRLDKMKVRERVECRAQNVQSVVKYRIKYAALLLRTRGAYVTSCLVDGLILFVFIYLCLRIGC
jgi:hypothetical protein